MNLERYLSRIGYVGNLEPNTSTLRELLRCHLEQVPFENLDCYQNPCRISSDVEDLYDKVVCRRRGGMCFELNGLFLWLLECLDFDVYPILVRIQMGSEKLEPISHQANVVTIEDRKYYCDVGFGGPAPKGFVELNNQEIQYIAGEQYQVRLTGCLYEILWYHHDVWEVLFSFMDLPAAQEDFEILMHYFSTCPDSEFVRCLMVNLCLLEGSLALTDNQFTARRGNDVIKRTLNTEAEMQKILYEEFHLTL